jgi:staphylococcal nuclease domain-containing protein 1
MNLAVEAVRSGNATPRAIQFGNNSSSATTHSTSDTTTATATTDGDAAAADNGGADEYQGLLLKAYDEPKAAQLGVHAPLPLVRSIKNAGDNFETLSLVQQSQKMGAHGKVKCVIEYVFDGSRFRCQVVDPDLGALQYASFTLLLAGVAAPRLGNTRADPPTPSEDHADDARQFVELRVLQRELEISLHGTDKSGVCAVGTIHHPAGNIAVELLKNGLAKIDHGVRRSCCCSRPSYPPCSGSGSCQERVEW